MYLGTPRPYLAEPHGTLAKKIPITAVASYTEEPELSVYEEKIIVQKDYKKRLLLGGFSDSNWYSRETSYLD